MPLVHPFEEVKAVFFDLDDTLCAYWEAAKLGLRRAFEAHPEHGVPVEQLLEQWAVAFRGFVETIGKTHWYEKYKVSGEITRIELMRRMLERVGIYNDDLAERMSFTYYVERHAALRLFPDARDLIMALRPDYALGVITNGPADIQRQELQTLQIEHLFGHIFVEGEVGFGKPDPRIFDLARESVALAPHQILFVGNSYKHDILPAQEAGWRTAWVRRDSDVAPSSRTGRPEELPEGATPPDLELGCLKKLLAG